MEAVVQRPRWQTEQRGDPSPLMCVPCATCVLSLWSVQEEEERRIEEYAAKVREREAEEEARKAAKREAADKIYEQIKAQQEAEMRRREEEERLINLLREEQEEEKRRQADRERREKEERMRREMMEANEYQKKLRAERKAMEEAEEAEFRRQMMAKVSPLLSCCGTVVCRSASRLYPPLPHGCRHISALLSCFYAMHRHFHPVPLQRAVTSTLFRCAVRRGRAHRAAQRPAEEAEDARPQGGGGEDHPGEEGDVRAHAGPRGPRGHGGESEVRERAREREREREGLDVYAHAVRRR